MEWSRSTPNLRWHLIVVSDSEGEGEHNAREKQVHAGERIPLYILDSAPAHSFSKTVLRVDLGPVKKAV